MPAAPASADLERLLQPISDAAPAGVSLRYEGTYDRVREARREDDASLPQGVWTTKLKVADWSAVVSACTDAIEHRSKDLQLAAWLAEAWSHQRGFAGVPLGLELFAALVTRFWEAAFPEIEDGGLEARADMLGWLDEVLSRQIRQIPLGEPGPTGSVYRLVDWEAGTGMEKAPRGAISEGDRGEDAPPVITRETLLARMTLLGKERWSELRRDATAGIAAAEHLEGSLDARMPNAPVLRRTKDALRVLLRLTSTMLGTPPEAEGDARPPGGDALGYHIRPAPRGDDPPLSPMAPIESRAEAYLRLSEAADYLLHTEPHSPVPYLVKRAVSWGNMSLAELLFEFVSSPDDLVTIQRLLGMRGKE